MKASGISCRVVQTFEQRLKDEKVNMCYLEEQRTAANKIPRITLHSEKDNVAETQGAGKEYKGKTRELARDQGPLRSSGLWSSVCVY